MRNDGAKTLAVVIQSTLFTFLISYSSSEFL
jgi:hypothetical protein